MNIKKVILNIFCCLIPGKQRRGKIRSKLRSRISQKLVKVELCDKNFSSFIVNNENILSVLRSLGKFRYIVNPGNLGDCLIETATFQFFEDHQLLSYITNDKNCENIVYAGGAPWVGAFYPEACLPALSLFAKAKKIVILPSSIIDCPMLTDTLDSRYVIFCREKRTYKYLEGLNTKAKVYLDCDMALRMTKDVFNFTFWSDEFYLKKATEVWNRVKDMGKVACFFRDDVEKFYDLQTDYDLSAAFSPNMTAAECQFATVLMLSVVDRFDVIVTDRLHVGIAAILMNKEVYLFDNNYGKISAVYEHSFSAMKNVHLCCEADWLRIQKIKNKNESIDNLSLLLNAMRVDV